MLNARVVDIILRFLSAEYNEEHLNDLIRRTQDPQLMVFAHHLVIHRVIVIV